MTNNKEHPRDFGSIENATKLSDLSKQGITLARFRSLYDSRNGGPLSARRVPTRRAAQLSPQASQDVDAFQAAVRAGRLLPDQPNSAWDLLPRLRAELPPEQMFLQENALRIALENQAQQVLLRYLAGDQSPQTKSDFDAGSRYMEAAMRLTPESLYLEGRDDFFQGRGLLFDKQYDQAANLLEQSVRIDPGEAYGYNALGIAYLEQADFARSIPAFRDAARRAPNWSYPLHNLALAYVEAGDYQDAIRSYQQAMRITPQFSYLPYNLGLVYQRLNRRRDAETAYRRAHAACARFRRAAECSRFPQSIGRKIRRGGKVLQRCSPEKPVPRSALATRHNLGLLLASLKGRQNEAIAAWRQNLAANPDYLASRLSLAELLAQTGDTAGAIEQYVYVVGVKPEYTAARVALAGLYLKANQADAALVQLRAAAKLDAQNASDRGTDRRCRKIAESPGRSPRGIRDRAEITNR